MADYVPIACMAHERLEFAVLRRQHLELVVQHASEGESVLLVLPTDVFTRHQAEWLSYQTKDGRTAEIRLDYIQKATPVDASGKPLP